MKPQIIELGHCRPKPIFAEGDLVLKDLRYAKLSKTKILFFILSIFLTAGAMLLLAYWSMRLRRWFLYTYVDTLHQATHFQLLEWDDEIEFVKKQRKSIYDPDSGTSSDQICFTNRNLLYVVRSDNTCSAVEMAVWKPFIEIHRKAEKPLDEKSVVAMRDTFGKCAVDFNVPGYFNLFLQEVMSPFFMFQIYSVIVWYVESYNWYSIAICVIMVFIFTLTLYELKNNLKKIHKMAFFMTKIDIVREISGQIQVLRNLMSIDIVPGDIIILKNGMKVPCDCLLLKGQALLNECPLTGESVPVSKSAAPFIDDFYNPSTHKLFTIYEGTIVMQISKNEGNDDVKALVLRTGFYSIRGQLIRSILYPKAHSFKFTQQIFWFMLVLGAFTLIGFIIDLPFIQDKIDSSEIAIHLLDLVTIAVPPALPITLSLCVTYAMRRLKKKGIYCISPPRISVAGRVDTVCFDKTGTITYDDLELAGVCLSHEAEFVQFLEGKLGSSELTLEQRESFASSNITMATCHDIAKIDGKVYGDPMEVKLIAFSQYEYTPSPLPGVIFSMQGKEGETNFAALKKFEFDSLVQRMSVIVAPESNLTDRRIYSKGAPEIIKTLCRANTIPSDYDECLYTYTSNGYRVLSLAYRELTNEECIVDISQLDRKKTESDLKFLGFCVFENTAKPESKPTIKLLNDADVMVKISTGDNPTTAAAVAKDVAIIAEDSDIVICDLVESSGKLAISLENIEHKLKNLIAVPLIEASDTKETMDRLQKHELSNSLRLILKSLSKLSSNPAPVASKTQKIKAVKKRAGIELVFTGKVFAYFLRTMEIARNEVYSKIVRGHLCRSKVFSRMQSNHKIQLIEMLQKEGKLVAMVGDGANDVGALRAADVGLALSQAEASISAPFNSKVLNISSLLEILKEGRCTLATNFHTFKFMALYSMIQFIAVVVLYTQIAVLSTYQYTWQDMAVVMPLFIVMGYTRPYHKLTSQMPDDSLISANCLVSVICAIIIQALGSMMMLLVLKAQTFYVDAYSTGPGDDFNDESQESGVIFYFSTTLMIFSILAFSSAAPFRKPFYTNIPFVICIPLVALPFWLIATSESTRVSVFGIPEEVPGEFLGKVLGLAIGVGCLMIFVEVFVTAGVAKLIKKCMHPKLNEERSKSYLEHDLLQLDLFDLTLPDTVTAHDTSMKSFI